VPGGARNLGSEITKSGENERSVSHCGLAIYMKKYLKAKGKRRIMETQIFHHAKI
jgi:hypothetical protein